MMRNLSAAILSVACICIAAPSFADGSVAETHRFYVVHGAKLYVQTYGSGPPIVFLHGGVVFFDNSFAKQRDYFASSREVIGIDQSGAQAQRWPRMLPSESGRPVRLGSGTSPQDR